jgi:hypothetical protein
LCYGRVWFGTVGRATDNCVLSVRSLAPASLKPGIFTSRALTFSQSGFRVLIAIDTRGPGDGWIAMMHDCHSMSDKPEKVVYKITLTATRPRFGGVRYWFCCPSTGRRVFKLYLPCGGKHFLARETYKLGYACQRETRVNRLMRKARKLRDSLGDDTRDIGEIPLKPKGMWRRTYERKAFACHMADHRADQAWLAELSRFNR